MIIQKRRIHNLKLNLPTIKDGQKVVIGAKNIDNKEALLKKIGFENTDTGATVLHKDRIIHRVSWFDKIKNIFK